MQLVDQIIICILLFEVNGPYFIYVEICLPFKKELFV